MRYVLAGSLGLTLAGPPGALIGCVGQLVWTRLRSRADQPGPPPRRVVLIILLVELRSGQSVLGALRNCATALPEHRDLARVARVAAVSGLAQAVEHAPDDLRPVVAQLARAQRSGSSLAGTVRRLLDDDLKEERTSRLSRARSLPARLMIPVTLLMLPGVVLLLYGPSLFSLYTDLFSVWP